MDDEIVVEQEERVHALRNYREFDEGLEKILK